jgi:hypothetical protein
LHFPDHINLSKKSKEVAGSDQKKTFAKIQTAIAQVLLKNPSAQSHFSEF